MRTVRVTRVWNGADRPRWAPAIDYRITDVVPRAVYLRNVDPTKRPQTIEAATYARGYVLPVRTAGRGAPPNAPGYGTADTPMDRGHLLALSLGGPDESYNITPQLFVQNRTMGSNIRSPISSLYWREFEVFVWYCAQLGLDMTSDAPPPRPGDAVNILATGWPLIVNNLQLALVEPGDVGRLHRPRFAIEWTGTFDWRRGTVGQARIRLEAVWFVAPPPGRQARELIADRSFSYQVDIRSAIAIARRIRSAEQRAARMQRERRDAVRRVGERLRARAGLRPPTRYRPN